MKIAVLGATGHVGREILQALADSGVPLDAVTALATASSQGGVTSYGEDDEITLRELEVGGDRQLVVPRQRLAPFGAGLDDDDLTAGRAAEKPSDERGPHVPAPHDDQTLGVGHNGIPRCLIVACTGEEPSDR